LLSRDHVAFLNTSSKQSNAQYQAHAIALEHIPFHLSDVVEDVLHVIAGVIKTNIHVDLCSFIRSDVPMCLIGDPSRLRQVLLNLLGNAAKFTTMGDVCLEVSVKRQDPLVLQFDISDTGIGMTEEQLGKLFRPFSQAESNTDRKFGGTGLGLSICLLLVRLFGGDISCTSRLGRGSTFTFTMPVAIDTMQDSRGPQAAFKLDESDIKLLKGLRVYVIDDNATNCMALVELLKQVGVREVASSRSGPEGIAALAASELKGSPFNVLILDFNMPQMDGLAVARALEKTLKEMPRIIVLTSSYQHNSMNSIQSVVACTEKPFRRQQLLYLICRGSLAVSSPNDFKDKRLLKGLHVLVVEDNEVNRMVLRDLVGMYGMTCSEAVNGVEALSMIDTNAHLYDVVMMDVHMPVMNGIDTTRLMRQRGFAKPIIALTADVTEETREGCIQAGVTRFLLKPIRAVRLQDHLEELFSSRVISDAVIPSDERPDSHILVVDDTDTNLAYAAHLLQRITPGGKITCATSGRQALDMLGAAEFTMVFMDIEMPGMNGLAATQAIRKFNKKVPVIALTADDSSELKVRCTQAGMQAVGSKPFRQQDLASLVSTWNGVDCETSDLTKRVVPPPIQIPQFDSKDLVDTSIHSDLPGALVKQLLAMWEKDSQTALSNLKAGIGAAEVQQVKSILHSLKGMSAQVGAAKVSQLAKELEGKIPALPEERAVELLAACISQTRVVFQQLREKLN
jgi:CheY-like chemotaxis protein